jgi:hypothetical protein
VVSHQLYVEQIYYADGLRRYVAAFDDRGVEHTVSTITHESLGCGTGFEKGLCEYREVTGIDVSDAQLQDYADKGVAFKIKAKDGASVIVTMTPDLPSEQLATLNPYVAKPYKVDLSAIPPTPIGADLQDEGVFNRKLYSYLDQGLHVGVVRPGSPLDKAGVKHYDWLWELNGVPLKRNSDLKAAMSGLHLGSQVSAKVRRGPDLIDVTVNF